MSFRKCKVFIEKEIGRSLTKDEDIELHKEFSDRIETLRGEGIEDFDALLRRSAAELSDEKAHAARIKKRQTAIAFVKRVQNADFILTQFGFDPNVGFRALSTGANQNVLGNRLSVDARHKAKTRQFLSGLQTDLRMAGLDNLFSDKAMQRPLARALAKLDGEKIPDENIQEDAMKIAKIVRKWTEESRRGLNAEGAHIAKLEGWVSKRSHDQLKIKTARWDQWYADIKDSLDPKTFKDVSDHEKFLVEVYNNLSTGVHLKSIDIGVGAGRGAGSLANKVSAERKLHFKSVDAWFDYNEKYGIGPLNESIVNGLQSDAQSIALMSVFGPNPRANAIEIAELVMRKIPVEQRSEFQRLTLGPMKEGRHVDFNQVDGTNLRVDNPTLHMISNTIIQITRMAKLGMMLIAQFSDLAQRGSTLRRFDGTTMLHGIAEGLEGLTHGMGPAERADVLGSLGVYFDDMAFIHRVDLTEEGGGKVTGLQQLFFKLVGATDYTNRANQSAIKSLAWRFGARRNMKFSELTPEFQNSLKQYAIQEPEWDAIRQAKTKAGDGVDYLVADEIEKLPDSAVAPLLGNLKMTPARAKRLKMELADKLRDLYADQAGFMVVTPDARTNAIIKQGARPGTRKGVLINHLAELKGFPVSIIQKIWGGEIYGRGSRSIKEAMMPHAGAEGINKAISPEMMGIAQNIIAATVLGYVSMTIADLLKGNTPRDPSDPRTWMAAMAKGGGLGIYGDFLFGEMRNRYGRGVIPTLMGPSVGTLSGFFDLIGRLKEGDPLGAASLRWGQNTLPFANVFYTKLALDYLIFWQMQEWMTPGAMERKVKRMDRYTGQTPWLNPVEAVR